MLDTHFVVAAADTGGLGITGLKGPYIQNVFMNTSATPGAGNTNPATPGIAVTNPNPAAGTIIVQLQDNYAKFYSMEFSIRSPNGTPVAIDAISAALTPGVAYAITTLGDATAAQWLALGVPAGVTPAVGVSFIALVTGSGASSTSRVAPSATAGSLVLAIERVGDANLSLAPLASAAQGYGAQIILQCRDAAGAIVAPAAGSVINLCMLLGDSSVLIGGE